MNCLIVQRSASSGFVLWVLRGRFVKKLRRNRARQNLRQFCSFFRFLLQILSVSTFRWKCSHIFELSTFTVHLGRLLLAIYCYLSLFQIIFSSNSLRWRLGRIKPLSFRFLLDRLPVASDVIRTPSLHVMSFLWLELALILIYLHLLDIFIRFKHNLINILNKLLLIISGFLFIFRYSFFLGF